MRSFEHDPSDDALEELVQNAPSPQARPEFAETLRARFVSGELAKPKTKRNPRREQPPVAPAPQGRPLPADRRRWKTEQPVRRRPWGLVAGLAAAAAVVLFVWWDRFGQTEPSWHVVGGPGVEVVADGTRHRLQNPGLTLPPETLSVAATTEPVRLVWGDEVVLECAPGTRIDLVRAPTSGRRRFDVALHAGELRVATGPSFPGSQLQIRTIDATVDVVGTQFLVDLREDSTCICVREGLVGVTVDSERHEVGAATLHLVLRDTGALEKGQPEARHAKVLTDLAGFWAP